MRNYWNSIFLRFEQIERRTGTEPFHLFDAKNVKGVQDMEIVDLPIVENVQFL